MAIKGVAVRKIALMVVFCAAALSMVVGCGPREEKRFSVSGTVKFEGKPIENGSISFVPEGGRSADGKLLSPDGGAIENGSYACRVRPGKMIVQVTGAKRVKPQKGDDPTLILYEDFIPAEFNTESTLTIEISGDTQKNFDL